MAGSVLSNSGRKGRERCGKKAVKDLDDFTDILRIDQNCILCIASYVTTYRCANISVNVIRAIQKVEEAIEVAFLDRLPRYKDSIIIFIKCRVYGRNSMTYIYYWNHVLRFFASVACLRFRVGQ